MDDFLMFAINPELQKTIEALHLIWDDQVLSADLVYEDILDADVIDGEE